MLFSASASVLGSHVSPPWPSSEIPTSSAYSDASSSLFHMLLPGCCSEKKMFFVNHTVQDPGIIGSFLQVTGHALGAGPLLPSGGIHSMLRAYLRDYFDFK